MSSNVSLNKLGSVERLLSPLQRWLCVERPDVSRAFDLLTEHGQADFLTWWRHHGRQEYDAPEEAMQWGHLTTPYAPQAGTFSTLITVQMRAVWAARTDLQTAFDLAESTGRLGFFEWFYRSGLFEINLDSTPYVDHVIAAFTQMAAPDESDLPVNLFTAAILQRFRREMKELQTDSTSLERCFGSRLDVVAPELRFIFDKMPYGVRPAVRALSLHIQPPANPHKSRGANLIGYAHGAFGMGEHVRMSARALATQTNTFSIVDVPTYNHARQPEADIERWIGRSTGHPANIFHVNADSMAGALMTIGPSKAIGRYNIGYWAWELSKIPEQWHPSVEMIEEIWAPSRFIQRAFEDYTDKPVIYMPLAVDLSVEKWVGRDFFNLPSKIFLFFYMFDSYSYFERKNPFAALRAFQRAFPRRADVGIVIKTQNADEQGKEWLQLRAMAGNDDRVFIINSTLTRDQVFSLIAATDCFVSLHRSEGFGRGPAEAMWLGKPVIVTDYSGNTDFTTPDVALPVKYELIPVESGQYPFAEDQVWANPDEEHASWQMRRIVEDPSLARSLGSRAANLMRSDYSLEAVGRLYANRLRELDAL